MRVDARYCDGCGEYIFSLKSCPLRLSFSRSGVNDNSTYYVDEDYDVNDVQRYNDAGNSEAQSEARCTVHMASHEVCGS